MRGSASLTAAVNAGLLELRTLSVPGSARPFSLTTNWTITEPSTPESLSCDGYSGASPPIRATGFSTWNSMYGPWCSSSGFTPASLPLESASPVPPFTPLPVPPATPLPLKSFSLVTAFDRSTVGILVGTATGGGTIWKPFGGAGASTFGCSTTSLGRSGDLGFGSSFLTLGGGGSFLGGGGGSGFFISLKRRFSDRESVV